MAYSLSFSRMATKFILLLLGLMLTQQSLWAKHRYAVGDVLYVWAVSGLNLRTAASISSPKVGKLESGEKLEVISISTNTYDILAIDVHPELYQDNIYQEQGSIEPFYLKGTWVKVKGQKWEGYVIDSYLLKYAPPTAKSSIQAYFEKLYGESLKLDTTWHDDWEGAETVDSYSYEGRTKSGFGISGTYSMLATDHQITIPEMSLEEGFVFCNYFMPLEDGLRQKKGLSMLKFMGGLEEGIWFLESETCEFSISVENGKLYISEGCSC